MFFSVMLFSADVFMFVNIYPKNFLCYFLTVDTTES